MGALVVLGVLLGALLLGCLSGGDNWDGMDRSDWGWQGEHGEDPIATAVVIGAEPPTPAPGH